MSKKNMDKKLFNELENISDANKMGAVLSDEHEDVFPSSSFSYL